jgi:branched-chain amino acid transport system substrate-binding protein
MASGSVRRPNLSAAISRRTMLKGMGPAIVGGMVLPSWIISACGQQTPSSGTKIVKVGLVVSLTGPTAFYGQGARDGARQVFDAVNASGGLTGLGGATIDYSIYDAQGVGATAAAATQRAYAEGAAIVVGCGDSNSAVAATQAAGQMNRPFITGEQTDQITQRGFTSIFQTSPLNSILGKELIDATLTIAKENGATVTKANMVLVQLASTTSLIKPLTDYLASKGVAATTITYPPSQTTFSSIVSGLKSSGAEITYQISLTADGIALVNEMKLAGYNPKILAGITAGYIDAAFYSGLGPKANGLIAAMQTSNALAYPWLKAEVTKWGNVYPNRWLDPFAMQYMAVAATAVNALNRASSTSPGALINALKSTNLTNNERWVTIPGGIKFDSVGYNKLASGIVSQFTNVGSSPGFPSGTLQPIYPPAMATTKPVYPKPNWA